MSGLSVQQRELLVLIAEDPAKAYRQFQKNWAREIDQLVADRFIIIHKTAIREPKLAKNGTLVAKQERQMRKNDELAALHNLPWPKKQRVRWAIEKLAEVMEKTI